VWIFFLYEGAKGREITDQVSDDYAFVFRFGAGDSQRYVRCSDWITGGNYDCGVAAQHWGDLSSGVFPCNRAPAGQLLAQGEPS
jgi:hypothetical protein